MAPPIDTRDPAAIRTPSRGRCFLYVVPSAYEDLLKIGHSRDPLARLQSLHHRWFEVFDLEHALLVETDSVRDARGLELAFHRQFRQHNAPAPLTVQPEAGGHSEWYRGASEPLCIAVRALASQGFVLHDPAWHWLRHAMLARSDGLFSWTQAMLSVDELEQASVATPRQRVVRDALDAHLAFGIALEPLLPEAVWRWYCAAG